MVKWCNVYINHSKRCLLHTFLFYCTDDIKTNKILFRSSSIVALEWFRCIFFTMKRKNDIYRGSKCSIYSPWSKRFEFIFHQYGYETIFQIYSHPYSLHHCPNVSKYVIDMAQCKWKYSGSSKYTCTITTNSSFHSNFYRSNKMHRISREYTWQESVHDYFRISKSTDCTTNT